MLRKLISTALGRPMPDDARSVAADDPPRASAPDLTFPPMVPLHPPEARNDNPLTGLCAAVEADLRAAGYLR